MRKLRATRSSRTTSTSARSLRRAPPRVRVIQVRATDLTPAHLGPLVERALGQYQELLETGALITVEAARLRTRILPLKKRS